MESIHPPLSRSLSNHFMNCIRNSHEDISHKQIFRIISKVIEVLWCHIEGTIEQVCESRYGLHWLVADKKYFTKFKIASSIIEKYYRNGE